jgi:quinol monooxygenase YgiN
MEAFMKPVALAAGLAVLTSTLAAQAPGPQAAADGIVHAVAYVEAQAASVSAAARALKSYSDASRKQDGYIRVDVYEQLGRPGHFAIVEAWKGQQAFDAHVSTAQKTLLDALQPLRASGYDQRPYKTLTVGPAPANVDGRAVSVVSHVDVNQDPKVPEMLRRLADASRKEPGNLRFDIVQHTMRANHFTVVETWRNQEALDAHVAAAHTRQYRDDVQPMTGSPLDERVYRSVQ